VRRILLSLSVLTVLISACGPDEVAIQQSAVDAKVDSLVGLRIESVTKQAAEDLEKRQAIEVKVKADSIVQARMSGNAPQSSPAALPIP
jgi:hypothetical protein